jgi:hypothetical protein
MVDSRIGTYEHILDTGNNITKLVSELLQRICTHDISKLTDPEKVL